MAQSIEGGCRCGAVRYRLEVAEMPPVYCCHCHYCQTWSGSAFSQQAVVGEGQIVVTQGSPDVFDRANENGAISTQSVCGLCHSRLWNTNSARPGLAVVRAGTLDASDTLVPRAHIWIKRKQPWITISADIPCWHENAPPADFATALMKAPL